MKKEINPTIILVIVAIIGIGALFFSFNSEITAQATKGQMITAKGTSGTQGQITMTFPASGGAMTGTFSGTYVTSAESTTYTGKIKGKYDGKEGGQMQGSISAKGVTTFPNGRKYKDTYLGTYSATVSLAKGTITGQWRSNTMGERFNLKFTPVSAAQLSKTPVSTRTVPVTAPAAPSPFAITTGAQPSTGYCRCITGPRESGIEYSPYGGQGLEFKGFTTYMQCVIICQGKHSWRSR
jgi:hypothetical protein